MPTEESREDDTDLDRGGALMLLGIGLIFLFGMVAVTSGDGSPDDRIELRSGIAGGQQFETLDANATDRLRPALENGTDAGSVNESAYDETFQELPEFRDVIESDAYFIEYEDRFYRFDLVENGRGAYRIELTDETETVRIEYTELSTNAQDVVDRAAASDGPVNVSDLPPVYQSSGLSSGILGSQRLYYLSWDGQYYTVATYEPVEYVDTPASGQLFGTLGVLVGFLVGFAGYALRVRDS